MKTYTICYYLNGLYEEAKYIEVIAKNAWDAFDKATYEAIPQREDGHVPYAAYVDSVKYKNGNTRQFYYDVTRPC